jgi:Tol biopolymer transport system component
MKTICRIAFALFTLVGCASSAPKPEDAAKAAAPVVGNYLTDIRQLTFEGARAGESYFSKDGRYMVFQSEREKDNPFYQIYLMDTKTGSTHRVSPGQGKTTCSWISPDMKHILFASTHADPKLKEKVAEELETRKKPKGKYSWSFDDQFDIYETDFQGHGYKNLTHSPGYDAEGSYSPDGKWIAFASNRRGYTEQLNAEEKKLFARDPSTQMDIYIMRADGTQVKRLTTDLGYDGGPFFSPDGKRLVYRHFTTDGMTAEVHTMNIDGSDNKEITHLHAMSWAPFYHPSGEYFIFTTNIQGFQNFELYIVDVEGRREPVRVTNLPGFDGLPVFTPDGNSLVWSHTDERGQAQLYTAKWDDALARKALKLDPVVPDVKLMNSAIDPKDAQTWVEYLASEHMQGRATGSPQESEYMEKIAHAFHELGLKPYGGKDYLQKFEFTSGIVLDDKGANAIELQLGGVTEHPAVSGDWTPLSYSKNGKFTSAAMVFAGYGMVAPAAGVQPAYDSYANLDVKDKWAVVFAGLPDDVTNERRFFLHAYSRLQHKAMMARSHGALGLVVIEDSATPSAPLRLVFEGRSEDAGLPVIRLSPATADKLFTSAGSSRKAWTEKLAKGEIAGFPLGNASLQAEIALSFKKSVAHNTLAVLEVPGATSSVIVGAHGDHLGHGEMGNSLWRGEKGAIHYGADDNASGVAGVMEIAKDLSHKPQGHLKQNIIFAVWSGEEIGILGSSHFVKDLDKSKVTAYLNMDMIGRYNDQLMIQGIASAPEWKTLVEKISSVQALTVHTQEDPYLPSDALTFYMKQIPILMAFTGSHPQYHTPGDRPELINYTGLAKTAAWVESMTVALASSAKPLVNYSKVENTSKPAKGRSFRLYLGTVPDYTQDAKKGVVITGTSKDSPAEKAGLKAGDMIVELGGMKIQNLNDYVYCLQALKANQRTVMRVIRRGEEKTLDITPELKTAQ